MQQAHTLLYALLYYSDGHAASRQQLQSTHLTCTTAFLAAILKQDNYVCVCGGGGRYAMCRW